MDEQDMHWLRLVNDERRKHGDGDVPPLAFEFVMDRLEKEWFTVVNLPKPTRDDIGPEDSVCNICNDGECENSNAIVFCDGCNVGVHQDCYGVPYIPEGQWLCRKCMLRPEATVSCIFCPNTGGAFKQTTTSKWAHVVCAQWIPEARFSNTVYMEPIEVDALPDSRWKLQCFICRLKVGACIQCCSKNCYTAYHVTCARKVGLFMKMRVLSAAAEDVAMRSYCDKHNPVTFRAKLAETLPHTGKSRPTKRTKSQTQQSDDDNQGGRRRASAVVNVVDSADEEDDAEAAAEEAEKAATLAHTRSLLMAPVITKDIFVKISEAVRGQIRKKNQFIERVCKYWSLKREARRGAPLLKRLHLEPWTAVSSAVQEDENIKKQKYEILRHIRRDLERVRMLAELVKRREKDKLKRITLQLEYLDKLLHPLTDLLRPILATVKRFDPKGLFAEPVDVNEVTDYLNFIDHPMDFQTMSEKLERNEYRSLVEFTADIELICSNALIYNQPDTPWGRAAPKLRIKSRAYLETVASQFESLPLANDCGVLNLPVPRELFSYWTPSSSSSGAGPVHTLEAVEVDNEGIALDGTAEKAPADPGKGLSLDTTVARADAAAEAAPTSAVCFGEDLAYETANMSNTRFKDSVGKQVAAESAVEEFHDESSPEDPPMTAPEAELPEDADAPASFEVCPDGPSEPALDLRDEMEIDRAEDDHEEAMLKESDGAPMDTSAPDDSRNPSPEAPWEDAAEELDGDPDRYDTSTSTEPSKDAVRDAIRTPSPSPEKAVQVSQATPEPYSRENGDCPVVAPGTPPIQKPPPPGDEEIAKALQEAEEAAAEPTVKLLRSRSVRMGKSSNEDGSQLAEVLPPLKSPSRGGRRLNGSKHATSDAEPSSPRKRSLRSLSDDGTFEAENEDTTMGSATSAEQARPAVPAIDFAPMVPQVDRLSSDGTDIPADQRLPSQPSLPEASRQSVEPDKHFTPHNRPASCDPAAFANSTALSQNGEVDLDDAAPSSGDAALPDLLATPEPPTALEIEAATEAFDTTPPTEPDAAPLPPPTSPDRSFAAAAAVPPAAPAFAATPVPEGIPPTDPPPPPQAARPTPPPPAPLPPPPT
ncbi:PHD-zinc-finger like domain-containing protein, partial [Zopfochytrium polystomum]